MKKTSVLIPVALCAMASLGIIAQLDRERGNVPDNAPQTNFFAHRLGTDHAEGIAVIDMNGDGKPDLLSGAYWYEKPGAQGGEWKRHQYRTVETVGEFVSDCGE